MNADARVLAVDVGGTKTVVALASAATGARFTAMRFPTPATATETLTVLLRHCRTLVTESAVAGVGVSFGGHVDGGRVRSLHVPGWEDVNLVGELGEMTGAPVGVLNDADAGALAEYAARQSRPEPPGSLFYATVSTGIGGAFVLDGVVVRGAHGLAGELGHFPAGHSAPCSCGGTGHLEAIAAGPAIARHAARTRSERRNTDSLLSSLGQVDARAVAGAAEAGDRLAQEVLAEAATHIGRALTMCALCLDPAVICLGGGVSQSGAAFWDPLRATVRHHPLLDTPIEPALHGSDSALVGAALHGARLAGVRQGVGQ